MAEYISVKIVHVFAELMTFFMDSFSVLRFLALAVIIVYFTNYTYNNNKEMKQMSSELRLLRLRACAESGMTETMSSYRCWEFKSLMDVK